MAAQSGGLPLVRSTLHSHGRFLRQLAGALALLGAGMLAGCTGSNVGAVYDPNAQTGPTVPTGEVIGNGSVRVALLLPKTANGNAGQIGQVFQNSAALALKDFQGADIQLLVKDTGATADGGRAAAQQAISEGAEIILGPVFSQAVGGAADVARSSGIPVIAFSSDTTNAKRGIYLLSFLPQQDVSRVVSYAASQNKRSFIAILPDNPYGAVVEASFRQSVGKAGGRIVSITRYKVDPARGADSQDIQAKVTGILSAAQQADVVLIPDGGGAPAFIAELLAAGGVEKSRIQYLGSGQWDNKSILGNAALSGGWYPSPDQEGFKQFASRYRAAYGSEPPRNATLAYDATILAAGLVRSAGPQRFSQQVLTSRDGFLGIDGVFRFRPDGLIERGLAVYEVTGSGSRVISPAPRSFSAASY
ncbi:MAG: penicillin-binding protein activator [Stappiaceae bacterium]